MEKRKIQVKTMLSGQEAVVLDARRGRISRGAYLRLAALNSLPPKVPEINLAAWNEISRAAGNLATLATAMRQGHYAELEAIRSELCRFRVALLRGTPVSYHLESEEDEAEEEKSVNEGLGLAITKEEK